MERRNEGSWHGFYKSIQKSMMWKNLRVVAVAYEPPCTENLGFFRGGWDSAAGGRWGDPAGGAL